MEAALGQHFTRIHVRINETEYCYSSTRLNVIYIHDISIYSQYVAAFKVHESDWLSGVSRL